MRIQDCGRFTVWGRATHCLYKRRNCRLLLFGLYAAVAVTDDVDALVLLLQFLNNLIYNQRWG